MPSGGSSETKFQVIVTHTPRDAYCVHVRDQSNDDFATTRAADLWTALRMAVPYMAAAAEPDPFADLLQAARKVDNDA